MSRFALTVNTVRYLKLRQLYYQVLYRLRRPKLEQCLSVPMRGCLSNWPGRSYMLPATSDGVRFTFLGESATLGNDWNSPTFPKLWLYNLHYQDELNSVGADEREELNRQLIDKWIADNPPMTGNGWEPYCLSLRTVNWIKFFSRVGAQPLKPEWLDSLALQVSALEQQLEFHIQANHLFANAKALAFAGVFFGGVQGDRWLKKGLQLLDTEIREQFLADGAHYERSPMYQAILLWDIADLLTLQQNSPLSELAQRVDLWREVLAKGLNWLLAMTHPDAQIAFFNDATFGIAPTLAELQGYAVQLGIRLPEQAVLNGVKGELLQPSGFAVMAWPETHRLLADVAPVGPDYQPGHAHADTLSCELSLFGQRFFVNSGISQYGEDSERHRQRSTPAHNTVAVDGENSSEVWAGFRVARRARPFAVDLVQGAGEVSLTACHDGYHRLPGKVTHCRKWKAQAQQLLIEDQLTGQFKHAIAYWHFHPDIRVSKLKNGHFIAEMPGGQRVELLIEGGTATLQEGVWHPGFGNTVPNTHLDIRFQETRLQILIKWRTA